MVFEQIYEEFFLCRKFEVIRNPRKSLPSFNHKIPKYIPHCLLPEHKDYAVRHLVTIELVIMYRSKVCFGAKLWSLWNPSSVKR